MPSRVRVSVTDGAGYQWRGRAAEELLNRWKRRAVEYAMWSEPKAVPKSKWKRLMVLWKALSTYRKESAFDYSIHISRERRGLRMQPAPPKRTSPRPAGRAPRAVRFEIPPLRQAQPPQPQPVQIPGAANSEAVLQYVDNVYWRNVGVIV